MRWGWTCLSGLWLIACTPAQPALSEDQTRMMEYLQNREVSAEEAKRGREDIPDLQARLKKSQAELQAQLSKSDIKLPPDWLADLDKEAAAAMVPKPTPKPDMGKATPDQLARLKTLGEQIQRDEPDYLRARAVALKRERIDYVIAGLKAGLDPSQAQQVQGIAVLPTYLPNGFKLSHIDKTERDTRISYQGPGGASFGFFGSSRADTIAAGSGGKWKADHEYPFGEGGKLQHYPASVAGEDRLQALNAKGVRFDAVNLKPAEAVKVLESLQAP